MNPFQFDDAGNLLPPRPGHLRITLAGRLYDVCPFKVEISVIYRHPKGSGGWKVQHLNPTGFTAWKVRKALKVLP